MGKGTFWFLFFSRVNAREREREREKKAEKRKGGKKKLTFFFLPFLYLLEFFKKKKKQEHSSFPELRAAVAAIKPRRLVPTVTGGEFFILTNESSTRERVFLEREKNEVEKQKLTFFFPFF